MRYFYPLQPDKAPERVHSTKKQLDLTLDRVIFYAKQQVGRAVNAAKEFYVDLTDGQILEMFRVRQGQLPKRLMPEVHSAAHAKLSFIHDQFDASSDYGFNVS